MNSFDNNDRSRLAEDEYFRRKDAETLQRAREAERIIEEEGALADALGCSDAEACAKLYASGVRASSAGLVEWLPAVEVAWLDGTDEAERHALRGHLIATGDATPEAIALLNGWLTERPSDALFAAGRTALKARLLILDADQREALLARIVAVCEATGRAAGGYFGIGALSSQERSRIARIQRDLEQPL